MALVQGVGSSTEYWLLLLGGAALLGGGGFIVGVYFAAKRLAAAQQAMVFRYPGGALTATGGGGIGAVRAGLGISATTGTNAGPAGSPQPPAFTCVANSRRQANICCRQICQRRAT